MSDPEIKPHAVYTPKEVEVFLKISRSTMKRLLKRGMIKANKIGRQHRILGLEVLRLVSPKIEKQATNSYLKLKKKVVDRINKW